VLTFLAVLALQVPATTVSADTGGIFFHRGPDTLWVTNQTWASRDSAPKLPDCVYSGRSLRMLARDSMRVTIRERSRVLWSGTLRTGDAIPVARAWQLAGGQRFILLEVSAPLSPCGVNSGEAWFQWTIEPAVP
jgi:hypothetical protein